MGATPNNMLGQMLEERVRETATEQAKAEVTVIEALIAAELEKIGVPPHLTGLWSFIDAIAAKRVDHLAQAKLCEIVERTIATDQAPPASSEAIKGLAQSIGPGDTLVLSYPVFISKEQRVAVEDYARANMAPGCNVIVLTGGLEMATVLKAPEPTDQQLAPKTISTLVVEVEVDTDQAVAKLDALAAKMRASTAELEQATTAFVLRMSNVFAGALAKASSST